MRFITGCIDSSIAWNLYCKPLSEVLNVQIRLQRPFYIAGFAVFIMLGLSMKRLVLIIALHVCALASAMAQGPTPFQFEKIAGAFEQMRNTPGFDVSKPLQWGFFFFFARSPEALAPVRSKLEASGYAYVEEHRGKDGSHWLQLAMIEIHTPESLHKRNQELYSFASSQPGVTYDGWDVSRR